MHAWVSLCYSLDHVDSTFFFLIVDFPFPAAGISDIDTEIEQYRHSFAVPESIMISSRSGKVAEFNSVNNTFMVSVFDRPKKQTKNSVLVVNRDIWY